MNVLLIRNAKEGNDMIILVIMALIYCCLPWYIEVVIWLVNLYIPDAFPIIDEVLMFVPMVSKIKKAIDLYDFFEEYGKIILAILVVVVAIIAAICIW